MIFFSRSIIRLGGIIGAVFLLAVFLTYYFAHSTCAAGLVPCTNDCNLCYLLVGISNIFQYLTGALLTAAFLLGITIAGLSYMVSGAFPKALNFAKSAFANSLKGFVLALIAWVIINGIMNIVGYKNPTGGAWYQHECGGGGAQVANSNSKTACDAKNKKLESITIQCAEQKETLADSGSGFYIALDTLSEDEKGKAKQLKAIGKYSCDGTTSEEDITQQAEWKASDETQIKVAKGLVEAVAKNMTSENPPYVEAKYQDKNSNTAKVYINSCPNTATAEIGASNKPSNAFETLGILEASAQGNSNCKSCGQSSDCHFIYGNKDAKFQFVLIRGRNQCLSSNSPCEDLTGAHRVPKDEFETGVRKMAKDLDLGPNGKDDFSVYMSDLVADTDSSCPIPNSQFQGGGFFRSYGYVCYGKDGRAGALLNDRNAWYCQDELNDKNLLAHEQIGHNVGGLSDEYVECGATLNRGFYSRESYNCTSKEKTTSVYLGLGGYQTKWGKIDGLEKGCNYRNNFYRSSKNSIMNSNRTASSFENVNKKIIDYRIKNFPSRPSEWAETLNPNQTCD